MLGVPRGHRAAVKERPDAARAFGAPFFDGLALAKVSLQVGNTVHISEENHTGDAEAPIGPLVRPLAVGPLGGRSKEGGCCSAEECGLYCLDVGALRVPEQMAVGDEHPGLKESLGFRV